MVGSTVTLASFVALDSGAPGASMRRVPYRSLPPEERRRRVADGLYDAEPRRRPPWVDEPLLRSGQVAALFQVSRRTVSDWARAGKLEAIITPGGHRRFRAPQVRALLESMRAEAARGPGAAEVSRPPGSRPPEPGRM